jgi:hypothetical protein
MTSPSLPVSSSSPLPGSTLTSMVSSSPPVSVHARPFATPMREVRSTGVSVKRCGPTFAGRSSGAIVTPVASVPSALRRATLRHMRATSRSRLRTPASRV